MTPSVTVLYIDNHLLVAAKPAGIATQPDFEEACRSWLKEYAGKPGEAYLHVVHRIDTPVSGIVICARTSKALGRLHAAIRDHTIRKSYIALAEGSPPAEEGVLEHYLFHDMHKRCAVITDAGAPHAKRAELSYRVLEKHKGITKLAVELTTGRYHQIRAQLSAIGCPIVGDAKYGSRKIFEAGAIALHHAAVDIPHPTLQKHVLVEAPLPTYWRV